MMLCQSMGQDEIHLFHTTCPTLHQLPGGRPGSQCQWHAWRPWRDDQVFSTASEKKRVEREMKEVGCQNQRTMIVAALACMMDWPSYLFDVWLLVYCKSICSLLCINVWEIVTTPEGDHEVKNGCSLSWWEVIMCSPEQILCSIYEHHFYIGDWSVLWSMLGPARWGNGTCVPNEAQRTDKSFGKEVGDTRISLLSGFHHEHPWRITSWSTVISAPSLIPWGVNATWWRCGVHLTKGKPKLIILN